MNTMARLLVVEGENEEREALSSVLRAQQHEVVTADSPEQAVRRLQEPIDLVISDINLANARGAELLTCWKRQAPRAPLLLTVANGDSRSAVEAMKQGAEEYLSKPVDPDELLLLVSRCIEARRKDARIAELVRRLDERRSFNKIVGNSKSLLEAIDQARRAADVADPVLIVSEPGCGKKLIAETIHQNSARKENAFVVCSVSAPADALEVELFGQAKGTHPGQLDQADGGTLFLDDVGELPPACQARLLRVLKAGVFSAGDNGAERQADVRVIAATRHDLSHLVQQGEFDGELYDRLSAVTLRLPALRKRRDDIPLLVAHFLRELNVHNGRPSLRLAHDLKERLQQHDWPGNVRQLRNCLECMVALAADDMLRLEDLPKALENGESGRAHLTSASSAKLKDLEREAIEQALAAHGDNRTHAAAALGISVRTLQRKLKAWRNGDHGHNGHGAAE